MTNFYWNYIKEEYDILERLPDSDLEALKFIPFTDFSRSAYKLLRMEYGIKDSVKIILKIFSGDSCS